MTCSIYARYIPVFPGESQSQVSGQKFLCRWEQLGEIGRLPGFPQKVIICQQYGTIWYPNIFQKTKVARVDLGQPSLGQLYGTIWHHMVPTSVSHGIPILHRHRWGCTPPSRYFKNGAALLELALVQWATHEAVKRGFQPFIPPDLVRARDPGPQ